MFDTLSERLESAFKRLRGRGKLTEDQVNEALKEVRTALLEADVHLNVVREFISRVRERAVGQEVLKSLSPAQQVVKIVHEELVGILGGSAKPLSFSPKPPTVVMIAGLQGSGKTTAAGKLAGWLKRKGKRPILVACDLQRPAAVQQLVLLGEQVGVPVVTRDGMSPVEVAAAGVEEAIRTNRDVVIVDTARRLHVDEELMQEAADIKRRINPLETLFVADSMTGQDAATVAAAFLERVDFTGTVLTKLDGDARGGAALSIAHISGRPLKFISDGEKLDAFEPFHPDRLASRILGMGDVMTLIEKAEEVYEEEQARELEEKLRTAKFTFNDFLDQMRQIKKMGSLKNLLGLVPGVGAQLRGMEIDENQMTRTEAIICSMTRQERGEPALIKGSRRDRIARGSGTTTSEVNSLLKQFDQARKMMRAMAGGGGMPSMPHGAVKQEQRPKSSAEKRKPRPKPHRPNKKKKKRR
ncbi:MAG: signal recognition particle protein [Actinomycetota bacterium]